MKKNKTEFYRDYSFWIQLVSTATIVIGLLYTMGVFFEAEVEISSNSVVVVPFPGFGEDGSIVERREPAFIIPIRFTNKGGKRASLSHLRMTLSHRGKEYHYDPQYELDFSQFLKLGSVRTDAMRGPFLLPSIAPGESVVVHVLFVCAESSRPTLVEDSYTCALAVADYQGQTGKCEIPFEVNLKQTTAFLQGASIYYSGRFRWTIDPRKDLTGD